MSENPYTQMHVLVVDDEPFIRKLVERTLIDIGVGDVSQSGNGKEALDFLQSENNRADLVICDLEMPEMNGFEFVKQVRNYDGEKFDPGLPIIILTGHADEGSVKDATSLGIDGYLVKPFSRKSLEMVMLKYI